MYHFLLLSRAGKISIYDLHHANKDHDSFYAASSYSPITPEKRFVGGVVVRYEDSYVRAYSFDKLAEGMLQPEMVLETVEMVKCAIEKSVFVNLIVSKRADGKRSFD